MSTQAYEASLNKDNIIFAFTGAITYNMLSTLSAAVKEDLQKEESSKAYYNVYAVLVEQFQNIMNYSSKRKTISTKDVGIGTCLIKQVPQTNALVVCSGNEIETKQIDRVIAKLEKINSLNAVEIKAYYKEVRKSGVDSHDTGAGLGFLEMAKKSSAQLKYTITPIDEKISYFELDVAIKE